jgi:hypothetical protein
MCLREIVPVVISLDHADRGTWLTRAKGPDDGNPRDGLAEERVQGRSGDRVKTPHISRRLTIDRPSLVVDDKDDAG